jgi:hypothetical protein
LTSTSDLEKLPQETQTTIQISTLSASQCHDIEKTVPRSGTSTSVSSASSLDIHSGRPDVASMIRNVVTSSQTQERVIVAVCGPTSLANTTRETVASCVGAEAKGASVRLHCEEFGW